MDYKDTLLMPKTSFPMRGGLPNKEPQIQAEWDEKDLFNKILEKIKVKHHLFCMTDLLTQTVIYTWVMH